MRIHQRPRVLVNFAMTVDGKVSTLNQIPSTFTSQEDKRRLREIRSLADALLVGRKTVAIDSMSMGLSDEGLRCTRLERGQSSAPLRVILSRSGNLDPHWKVFQTPGAPIIIFSSAAMPRRVRDALCQIADIWLLPVEISFIAQILSILFDTYSVRTLLCEGGPTLFRSLLEANAVDEIYLTLSPFLFGGMQAPTLTGLLDTFLPCSIHAQLHSMDVLDEECFLKVGIHRKRNAAGGVKKILLP